MTTKFYKTNYFSRREIYQNNPFLHKQNQRSNVNNLNMNFILNYPIYQNVNNKSKPSNGLKAVSHSTQRDPWEKSSNNFNFYFPEIKKGNKPLTANCNYKRPKERLQKGQNQLILEKLQEKFLMQNTKKNFYNKTGQTWRKRLLSQGQKKSQSTRKLKSTIDLSTHYPGKKSNCTIGLNGEEINDLRVENNLKSNRIAKEKEIDPCFNLILNYFGVEIKYKKVDEEDNEPLYYENNNGFGVYKYRRKSLVDFEIIKKEIKSKKDSKLSQNKILNNDRKYSNSTKNLFTNFNLKLYKRFSFKKIYFKQQKQNEKKSQNKQKENINSKTSSNFFTGAKPEEQKSNINNLINRVLENNKRMAAAKSKEFFNEVGKEFLNNHMRHTKRNFFTANSANRFGNEQTEFDIPQKQPKTLNSLDCTLVNPIEWKKHEEIWLNISTLILSPSDMEKHLLPPNDNDVLISSYLKLHPNVLHFSSFSNISSSNKKNINYLSFPIDDNIQNPKKEIKKWKNAYKRVVLRWHPDKLFPVLNEIKFKDENKKNLLKKKSTVIINNMNNLYKKILEILRKIALNKNDVQEDEE